jgi:hypothetical protein
MTIEELAHRMAWRYKTSSDPAHSDTYTFNRATLLQFAEAVRSAPECDGFTPISELVEAEDAAELGRLMDENKALKEHRERLRSANRLAFSALREHGSRYGRMLDILAKSLESAPVTAPASPSTGQ